MFNHAINEFDTVELLQTIDIKDNNMSNHDIDLVQSSSICFVPSLKT